MSPTAGVSSGSSGSSGPVRDRLRHDPLRALLVAIGGVTVVSGAVQVVAPGALLGPLGAEDSAATRHLFATVGMFMVVVGAMLTQTLLSAAPAPVVLLWSGLQKLGAFVAVALGVLVGVFGPIALGVAFFDLATSVLLAALWRRGPRPAVAPARSAAVSR